MVGMFRLPDGSSSFLFPSPAKIAQLTVRELQSKTSAGYRAKSVVAVSRMIAEKELKLEELGKLDYEEALEVLLQLHGVGPKVADCFLLYGLGKMEAAPVDVWIHRIVTGLYFKRAKDNPSEHSKISPRTLWNLGRICATVPVPLCKEHVNWRSRYT